MSSSESQEQGQSYEEIDPDYASNNIALKRAEKIKEENANSIDKLKEILNTEFSKDLAQRENQIEQIEKQIHKTQKLLHLMRYVLISSYYNRDDLVQNPNDDEMTTNQDTNNLFDQNRIHPALKKLLGKNTSAPDFNMCRSARRNKSVPKQNLMVENLNESIPKTTNLLSENKSTIDSTKNSTNLQSNGFDRNRQKIKNRIIVGNISKWIPSYEDDNLTHKWMMYVRGPKENPDVSCFIQKVVFYLHPSYKPHDVIEISEPPFHLSRRGWGEFPVRVQIHFRCTLNKPVDIIHNLKLDKTYSGRQTLGNESIIDLYLYDDTINGPETFNVKEENTEEVKHELVDFTEIYETDIQPELKTSADSDFTKKHANSEHDYSSEDGKLDVCDAEQNYEKLHLFEHSYCSQTQGNVKIKNENINNDITNQTHNELIYGLGESYSELPEDSSKREPLYYRKTFVYTTKQTSGVKKREIIVQTKRKCEESLIKKMFTNKMRTEIAPSSSISSNIEIKEIDDDRNLDISISKTKFKNMGEVLPYLFKRLPLISNSVEKKFPFTANSKEEFLSWNVAKQSSAEWSRAKLIKKILVKEEIHEQQKWNTKALMMYAQSHGYSPKINYVLFGKNSKECKLINNCFISSAAYLLPQNTTNDFEPMIDIENDSETHQIEKKFKLSEIDQISNSESQLFQFIRKEALECGIVLKNEYIDGDYVFNGAQKMILEAVKCFTNHLIRRSLHFSIVDGSYRSDVGEIQSSHILQAVQERKEFDALHQFRKKQTELRYFFH